MSGFEIFGVVAAVGPIMVSTVPAILDAIETLRYSKRIKQTVASAIVDLCRELKVSYMVLTKIAKRSPTIDDPGVANDFRRLFENFPTAVEKIRLESKRLIEKTTLGLLVYRYKLEETIFELDRLLQRLFRRITLLVFHLRESPGLSQHIANEVLQDVDRSSRIRALLEARLNSRAEPDIFIADEAIDEKGITGSTLKVAKLRRSGVQVVIESRIFSAEDPLALETAKFTIERLMGTPSRHWPILNCHGAQLTAKPNTHNGIRAFTAFDVLYTYPVTSNGTSSTPQTLRSILRCVNDPIDQESLDQPLNIRLRLAREVATSVLFVHIAGLVHKNIRPETILLFPSTLKTDRGEPALGNAFLVGFTQSREAWMGYSAPIQPDHPDWYDHPNRQDRIVRRYSMLHDIYALGVVLLEIGLWQSFVGNPKHSQAPATQSGAKTLLTEFASETLPYHMGTLYTKVVLRCLSCMDGEEIDAVLGVKYIEIVLDQLDKLEM